MTRRKPLQDLARAAYFKGVSEDANFYYDQVDDKGLAAVYKAGVAAGRAVTNVDFGLFIGDGDTFIINDEEYKARFINDEDFCLGYGRPSITLTLVKDP